MADDCTRRDCIKCAILCILLPIFLGSVVCLGIFSAQLNNINNWLELEVLEGECMYQSSIPIRCSFSTGHNRRTSGLRSGYIYSIRNSSDAYELCTESTFVDVSTSCQADDEFVLNIPNDEIDVWQTCYVIDCGEEGVIKEIYFTEKDYVIGVIKIIITALVFVTIVAIWFRAFCYEGCKRKCLGREALEKSNTALDETDKGEKASMTQLTTSQPV